MRCFSQVDRKKTIQLIIGIISIWTCYILCGILLQEITTTSYKNILTGKEQKYVSAAGLLAYQKLIIWLTVLVWNHFTLPQQQRIKVQMKNVEITGFLYYLSQVSNVASLSYVSFPIFNIFRSTSVLFAILVGVMCSKVSKKQFKLKKQKIIIGALITIGIVVYVYYDPQSQQKAQNGNKTQLIGYFLLIVSLVADGFAPDFQAKIKQQYNPKPTDMLLHINKWSALVAVSYAVTIGQMIPTIKFSILHPVQFLHILLFVLPNFFGQIFIYRIIKSFKQHIMPIIMTTRRMFTVIISLVFFNHKTSCGQIIGIVIVFSVSIFEFLIAIMKESSQIDNIVRKQPRNNNSLIQEQLKDNLKESQKTKT